ncbi:ribosomal protein S5 domain 2-like protein [Abortiporus biennis]|nr:ribosomal protein S5 domain 2-like protein [Abortiporus biennis]
MAEGPSSVQTLEPAELEALKASTFRRLHPKVYLERFLAEKIRPDGREFDEWRDISVNVGSISTAEGSSLVRLGDTTIVCGVKAEIAEPELDRPEHGFLVPNIDLPAICSPKFKPGPPTEEAQVLSDRLNEALISSGLISTTSLCIERGKSVWVLYVDATCINYDGNAFDAALLAMVAALKNTQLPKAIFDEDTNKTLCTRKTMIPLELNHKLPLSFTFGVFDSSYILADPTVFEEPLLETTYTIIVNQDSELISVNQSGLGLLNGQDVLSRCIATSKARCLEIGSSLYKT